jgi:hypothetical protein
MSKLRDSGFHAALGIEPCLNNLQQNDGYNTQKSINLQALCRKNGVTCSAQARLTSAVGRIFFDQHLTVSKSAEGHTVGQSVCDC